MKLPKQKTDKLEIAKAQARESAEKNRNLLFGSMLIFAFLILVVLQTTDVDLLLGKAIKLPVVDVDIPLFAFYFLSAPLAFFVHLNLLRNIEAHVVKLQAWRKANQDKPLKAADLFPFIFDFAVVDQESPLTKPTRWLSQLVIYWLGVLTLLLIFWRFTDYQNLWITSFHAALLIIDLIVLRIAREKILDILSNNVLVKVNENKNLSAWEGVKRKLFLFLGGWTCIRKGKEEQLSQVAGFIIALVSYGHVILFIAFILPFLNRYNWIDIADNISIHKTALYNQISIDELSFLLPILIIDRRENLLAFDESLLRLQHKLSSDSEGKFGEWFMEHGVGLDLRERNLRYAQLGNADLRRAQLADADLFEAHLYRANLQGANLHIAHLQGAGLWAADLQGADLSGTDLQGAYLFEAELQGAYLRRAKLQGADLRKAKLQGANLGWAKLQGADLRVAKLQGADLIWAELQGANLGSAELQGADLRWAELQGANLWNAKLQGANLRDIKLQGANLRDIKLQGADLRDIKLQGADLTDAIMEDIFTNEDAKWIGEDNTDWKGLRQLADAIEFSDTRFSSADQMKAAYLKRLDAAEARITQDNQEIPELEPVSVERLIKTLTQTLCGMSSEPRKYTLEGIIGNYATPSNFWELTPPEEMLEIHNHFKNLQGSLSCKYL